MTIQGSLESVNLADILQLIGFGQKTGKLNIEAKHLTGEIYFDKGNIRYASTSDDPFNIDKVLLEKKLVSEKDLKSAAKAVEKNKSTLVGELISGDYIQEEALIKTILQKLSEIMYSFFHLKTGNFHFEPDITFKDFDKLQFQMNINNIIMEGSRRIDEWELIEEVIPKSTTVFRFTKDFDKKIVNLELHKNEKEVLRLIDGKNDVKTIRKKLNMDDFATLKILFSLIQAKIIEVIPEAEEEKISEFYTLGQFYFERENYDEAVEELKNVLKHNHLAIYVINLLGKIYEINNEIDKEVAGIVNNADFNYLKVGGLSDEGRKLIEDIYKTKPIKVKAPAGPAASEPEPGPDSTDLQVHYKAAVQMFKKGDYDSSLQELDKALAISSKSHKVYFMKGNILFKKKDYKGAVENWEKSLELNPDNTKLKKNLEMIKKKLKI